MSSSGSSRPARAAAALRRACTALIALVAGCADQPSAPVAPLPDAPRAYVAGDAGVYTQLGTGTNQTCGIRTGGEVVCWGANTYGQTTVPAAAQSGVTQVSAGNYHTCALGAGGAVTCWGDNTYGKATVPAAGLSGVTQVSAGDGHTCAVGAGGAVSCWGDAFLGATTVPEAAQRGVTQVSARAFNTCALGAGGAVLCWGNNGNGQTVVPVAAQSGVTQVSTGSAHACAVGAGGAVHCWGAMTTVPEAARSGVTQVSAGGGHACAVGAGGAVTCWGGNGAGQTDVPAAARSGVTQVAAANNHTCALSASGAVLCWGRNGVGQTDVPGTTRVAPTATFGAPTAPVVVGQSFTLTLADAQVSGYPEAVPFTYAFDCGTGTYGAASSAASASCATSAGGVLAVRGKVIDQHGDAAVYSARVTVGEIAQTVAFTSTPTSPHYVGATYALSATGGASGNAVTFSSLTPATCTVSGATATFVAAGPCTLAADQAGTANYLAAQATQAFPVSKRPQAFTLTTTLPASAVVTSTFTLGATPGASGIAVVFASQTPATCTTTGANGTTLMLTGAGLCTVQATEAGNATYADAPAQTLGLTVLSPAHATIALRTGVTASVLALDLRQALTAKLDAALAALAAGKTKAACGALADFASQVRAQRGRAIPLDTAAVWMAQVAAIQTAAGC